MTILIATMAGGHSINAKYLLKKHVGEEKRTVIVTSKDDSQDYDVDKRYEISPIRRDPKEGIKPHKIIINFISSLKIFLKERPGQVYCCGANNSLFFGIISKIFGRDMVALETSDRITVPSKSPKILNKLGARIWTSTEKIKEIYGENAECVGFMHPYVGEFEKIKRKDKTRDYLIIPSSINENIEGENVVREMEHGELMEEIGKTKVVITRGGLSAWEAANLAEKVIVVPIKEAHENHQERFARWLKENFDNVEIRENFEREIKKIRNKFS